MTEETINGNKLIAEFMGVYTGIADDYYYIPEHGAWERVPYTRECDWADSFRATELRYHSSWDWLMPVVEKIESLNCSVRISQESVEILEREEGKMKIVCSVPTEESKIIALHKAVIGFIKWFNWLNNKEE